MSKITNPYLALLSLKVVNIQESEMFYDVLFECLGPFEKKNDNNFLAYWGVIGLAISEQFDIVSNVEPDFRLGCYKYSIRVINKDDVLRIFKNLKKEKYPFSWEPKPFDYGPGYYSFCVFDPDYNQIEIFYVD